MEMISHDTPGRKRIELDNFYLYDLREGRSSPGSIAEQDRIDTYPLILEKFDEPLFDTEDRLPHPLQLRAFREARKFVEETIGADLSAIELMCNDDLDDFTGHYITWQNRVYIAHLDTLIERSAMTAHALYQGMTAVLVHELSHAATSSGFKVIGFAAHDDELISPQPVTYPGVLDMRRPAMHAALESNQDIDLRIGKFFEEAMAEEMAARWREQTNPYIAKNGETLCNIVEHPKFGPIALRYLDKKNSTNETTIGVTMSASAYCAEGLRRFGTCIGIDMIQLLINFAGPDKDVASKRLFVQALEAVKPGLYAALRDLPYSEDGFIAGFEQLADATREFLNS